MNAWVKRMSLGFGLLAVLGVALLPFASLLGERKRERSVDVAAQGVAWATEAAGIERGQRRFRASVVCLFLKTVPPRNADQR